LKNKRSFSGASKKTAFVTQKRNTIAFVRSLSGALNHPFLLTEGAPVVLLNPQGHATVVEGVLAFAPHHHASFLFVVCLASQAVI